MKTTHILAFCCAGALSLAACDQISPDGPSERAPSDISEPDVEVVETEAEPSAPDLPARPASTEATAEIDWNAARADLAAIPSEDRQGAFQIASDAEAPPVPILLPTGLVMPAGAESDVRFQPLEDGYFASYPGIDYDIIVNGTNEVIGTRQSGGSDVEDMRFQTNVSGAQVSLSRYGADYLIEFECKDMDGGEPACISEEEALEIARKLVIAGTR